MRERRPRWHWSLLLTLVLTAGGLLHDAPALLAAAILPLALVAWQSVGTVAEPGEVLVARRDCSPESPMPGERVTVELIVENVGDATLTDVRVRDGVPEELSVVDGASGGAAALRPGEELLVEYELEPTRGTFAFEGPAVRLRSLAGTAIATERLPVEGRSELAVGRHLGELTLARRTTGYGGTVPSDTGGPGFEFYATREYRAGDPLNRVDWRRLAKEGVLGTVVFREHRSTKTVIVVDARTPARARPAPDRPDGATVAAYAAVRSARALRDGDRAVGLAALGVRANRPDVYGGPPAYVEPGTDVATAARIRQLCDGIAANDVAGPDIPGSDGSGDDQEPDIDAADPSTAADADDPPESSTERGESPDGPSSDARDDHGVELLSRTGTGGRSVETLLALLPTNAQVIFCSPLLDDGAARFVRDLRTHEVPVTVLSPDLTHGRTPGARLEALRRDANLERLRATGTPVVDWDRTEPLRVALEGPLTEGVA